MSARCLSRRLLFMSQQQVTLQARFPKYDILFLYASILPLFLGFWCSPLEVTSSWPTTTSSTCSNMYNPDDPEATTERHENNLPVIGLVYLTDNPHVNTEGFTAQGGGVTKERQCQVGEKVVPTPTTHSCLECLEDVQRQVAQDRDVPDRGLVDRHARPSPIEWPRCPVRRRIKT